MMGKKKTTSEQTNRPIYEGQITGAANQAQAAYTQAQPFINQTSQNLGQASQALFDQARQGDPTIQAAQGALQGILSGGENPYLQNIINSTNDSVRNQAQARMAVRGQTGGSDYANIIARALASNETNLRYNDFDTTRQRQLQAAQMAPGLLAGSYLPLQMAAQTGTQAGMLPLQASAANAGQIGGLLGQYQNVKGTQTQSGGLLESILGGAFQLGSAAIMGCDIRLKENITHIGQTPAGVPLYSFDYIGGAKGVVGPMAQEVAILQPEALGPIVEGFMTVNVGALK